MQTKKLTVKLKKYLKSKDWEKKLKDIESKHEERERIEKQEQIKWWNEIKDLPFGVLADNRL